MNFSAVRIPSEETLRVCFVNCVCTNANQTLRGCLINRFLAADEHDKKDLRDFLFEFYLRIGVHPRLFVMNFELLNSFLGFVCMLGKYE